MYKHIPLIHFPTWEDYRKHAIYDWVPVAVEFGHNMESLETFEHPKRAVYLLGPEDGSLCVYAIALAKTMVSIPSKQCLNQAVAGSIVMYDRIAKLEELCQDQRR